MTRIFTSVVSLAAFLVLTCAAHAETVLVPVDYDTIQEAIDDADDGDTILVEAGFYIENLDFLGKELELIACDGPEETTINGSEGTLGDEFGSVITVTGGSPETNRIEGFRLVGGNGAERTGPTGIVVRWGGGVLVDDGGVTIVDCEITDNANGGIHGIDASVVVENCVLTENGDWGAIGVRLDSELTVRNCVVEDNGGELAYAGGITVKTGSTAIIEDTDIIDNGALFSGGLILQGPTEMRRCTLRENSGIGGAMFVALADGDELEVSETVFEGNEGTAGGCIAFGSATSASFVHCLFVDNEATRGGAFYSENATMVTLDRCSIVDNTAEEAGAIHIRSDPVPADAEFELIHCILWGNGDDPLDEGEGDGDIRITYSCVEGDWSGTGNIDEDPEFTDDGDYRLTEDSPCIDAGDPDVLDPDGTTADMGVYYFRQSPIFIRGDVDGNLVTSALLDSLFLLTWTFDGGDEPPCLDAADVDDSGAVGSLVDSIALLRWGFVGGAEPPTPGPYDCGFDPDGDDDDILCESEPDCAD